MTVVDRRSSVVPGGGSTDFLGTLIRKLLAKAESFLPDGTFSDMNSKLQVRTGTAFLLSLSLSMVSFSQGASSPQNPSITSKYDALSLKIDDEVLDSKYDVVGLKLGMNAAEVKKVLLDRLHITAKDSFDPKSYQIQSGKGLYVPGRVYVLEINNIFAHANFYLKLHFVEVAPGEGKGPEMLTSIYYATTSSYDKDEQAFAEEIRQKFGKPSAQDDALTIWTDVTIAPNPHSIFSTAVRLREKLQAAGLPILELNVASQPSLLLENSAIGDHMQAVFLAKRTPVTPPPV